MIPSWAPILPSSAIKLIENSGLGLFFMGVDTEPSRSREAGLQR